MQGVGRRTTGRLLLACACLLSSPAAGAEETPVSVVDWLHAHGGDAGFGGRARLFDTHFPGEVYRGTAEQNLRLLAALRSGSVAPVPGPAPVRAPATGREPDTRQARAHGWRVRLDPGSQVLRLDMPEEVVWEQQAGRREEPVRATLPLPTQGTLFVSAAVLGAKAKQFDDGLYAAVEVASHRGHQDFPGRSLLLQQLVRVLAREGAADRGSAVVCAARAYGTGRAGDPLPGPLRAAVARERAAFEGDPLRSKPVGFYTWSDELIRIFRQDRMLQTRLTSEADVETVARRLRGDPWLAWAYPKMLSLASGLTNPLRRPDVLQRSTAGAPSVRRPYHVLPPSRSHEVDLAERLWGGRRVPEGADLFDELISRVRDGSLSLAPRRDSGWYDHVTWSLEPFLRPDDQPEASHLALTQGYRDHLEELFKGLLALARETHVKQLDIGMCGACAPPPTIHVRPDITVEPLATHYRRRADAYRFVREVLEEAFGDDGLRSLRRLTSEGPVAVDLDTELELMTRIFDGAAATALAEIGSSDADRGARDEADRAVFRTWRALVTTDPDLTRDGRMMVPVFYDVERRKTKVWAFLGWQDRPLTIAYAKTPRVVSLERLPGGPDRKPEVGFLAQSVRVAYPVVAEVYVTQLLDRPAFRAHCDRWKTRSAILEALR